MKAENDGIYQQILLKNKDKINSRKISFKLLKMKLKSLFYQGKEIDEIKITIQTEYKTKNSKKKFKPKQYIFKNSVSLEKMINFFENNEFLQNFIKNNHILKKWID